MADSIKHQDANEHAFREKGRHHLRRGVGHGAATARRFGEEGDCVVIADVLEEGRRSPMGRAVTGNGCANSIHRPRVDARVHTMRGPVSSPTDAASADPKLKELFFFDMPMGAGSPAWDDDGVAAHRGCDALAAAVEDILSAPSLLGYYMPVARSLEHDRLSSATRWRSALDWVVSRGCYHSRIVY